MTLSKWKIFGFTALVCASCRPAESTLKQVGVYADYKIFVGVTNDPYDATRDVIKASVNEAITPGSFAGCFGDATTCATSTNRFALTAEQDQIYQVPTTYQPDATKPLHLFATLSATGQEIKQTVQFRMRTGTPVAGSPVLANQSTGQGGATGKRDESFTASNGLSSRFEAYIPQDVHSKSYGLLVYLHGDNFGELKGGYFQRGMQELGQKYNLIPVAVYSPDPNTGDGTQWWGGSGRYAKVLHELLTTKLGGEYQIDFNRSYFYGQSGGSQFVTKYFVALYGQHYRGGIAPMCGGNSAEQSSPVQNAATVKQNLKFFFYTNNKDFLYPAVEKTMAYYRRLGFDVSYESPPDASGSGSRANHCHQTGNNKMDVILGQWNTGASI